MRWPNYANTRELRLFTVSSPDHISAGFGTLPIAMGNVYVIGSINMDVVASALRHPTVGETVAGSALDYFPGGKGANQAVAAARIGAQTFMVGRLGEDGFASVLSTFLAEQGIDLSYVDAMNGHPTGTALIVVAAGDNTIVVVPGANETLRPSDVVHLPFASGDVVVAQFETPMDTALAAFQHAKERGVVTVLNPAPAAEIVDELLALTDVVVVNETELATLSQQEVNISRDRSVETAVESARSRGEQAWIVTLGRAGILVSEAAGSQLRVQGYKVLVKDTTGAGDCFVGVLAAQIAGGKDLDSAARTANAAAALCVKVDGAGPSMPTAAAVGEFIGHGS